MSAYAAKYGKIIAASCKSSSLRVRPTGQNATYPPVLRSGNPSGYHVMLDIGRAGTLEIDVSVTGTVVDIGEYTRFVGTLSGKLVQKGGNAKKALKGKALFEQFKLTK
jgi:hypothetical protein